MHALNIMDEVMVSLQDNLRRHGGVGMPVQSYVLLRGRMDAAGFRTTLARLAQRHPIVGARLAAAPAWGRRQWIDPKEPPELLRVAEVDGAGNSGVWRYAEGLFAQGMDPRAMAPVQFHLLHLPDGRDAVILQWAHSLMDGKAGELLLHEVNRLHARAADNGMDQPAEDPLQRYLGQHSLWKGLKGILALLQTAQPSGAPIQLPVQDAPTRPPGPVRIQVRALDAAQSAAYQERVRRLCGFSNPAPVLVAAGFRAVRRLSPQRLSRRHACYTHVPVNLRAPRALRPIFGNLQTYIAMSARLTELVDFASLTRQLQAQFRQQIRGGVDLGYLWGIRFLSRRHRLSGHLLGQLRRFLSFVFGYHGTVAPGLERFCGTEVEELFSGLPPAWSPPGLTLAAHQYQGRLQLMTSYVPTTVSETVVGRFLDALTEDLVAPS